jgi:hypothetical protein
MQMPRDLTPFFQTAIDNIVLHGDTDIFPYPIENHILRDKKDTVVELLNRASADFDSTFAQHSPSHISALIPVGPTGFRSATQQDPFWNAYLLGITLSMAEEIENARIPTEKRAIFSYRVSDNFSNGDLFRDDVTWKEFIAQSINLAGDNSHVVMCDIADCYPRIYHHRLENALEQLPSRPPLANHIRTILSNFSHTNSYGLPVGGPAARILVELVLNLTDQLLKSHQITFCRYADDYHIFANSLDDAYGKLLFISEKLQKNDGLALQKSKTRIMLSSEFTASQSVLITPGQDSNSEIATLFRLNLRFDPYSANAADQYEQLKSELRRIDILGLLNVELAKTRVHGAVTKKLVSIIKLLDREIKEDAIRTLLQNIDNLYPIFPTVATAIKSCFEGLSLALREEICETLRSRISQNSYLLKTELNAAYAVRILAEMKNSENEDTLVSLYNAYRSPLIRRDVILIMANWRAFPWLSDQINEYQGASPWERRAFILASYFMGDHGSHWRQHNKDQFSPFEVVARDWASERAPRITDGGWKLPI